MAPSSYLSITSYLTFMVFQIWVMKFIATWVQILAQLFAVYLILDKLLHIYNLLSSSQRTLIVSSSPPSSTPYISVSLPHSLIKTPQLEATTPPGPFQPKAVIAPIPWLSPVYFQTLHSSYFSHLPLGTSIFWAFRIPCRDSCLTFPDSWRPRAATSITLRAHQSSLTSGTESRDFRFPGNVTQELPVFVFWGCQLLGTELGNCRDYLTQRQKLLSHWWNTGCGDKLRWEETKMVRKLAAAWLCSLLYPGYNILPE